MGGVVDAVADVFEGAIGLVSDVIGGVLEPLLGDMFAPESPEMGDSFGLQIRENAPKRTLYGEDVVGGNIVGYGKVEQNKKTYHVMHCVLVNHPCESVELESVNGQPAEEFTSLIQQEIQLGDHTTASTLALAHCYNWTENHIGLGQTMVTVKVEINEEKLPNGLSDIRWKVKGKKVYDPRKDSTIGGVGSHRADDSTTWEYSNTAILCCLDHLRFAGYKTIPVSKFDLLEIMSEANICDESVQYSEDGETKTEPRYTCNGMFQHTSGHGTVLSGMLNSCNGRVRRGGGKIRIKCGAYHGPALVTLTLDDASGPVKYNPWPAIANRLNSVRTSIIDPSKNYVKTALEPVVDTEHQTKSGLKLDAEIQVPFARTASLAKRLCNQAMAQANAGTIVFPTKKKGFLVYIGNTVLVSIPERGINKEFLIVKAEPKFNPEGDWEMELYLREESPALYPDDFIPVTDSATPNTSLPDTTKPLAPINLVVDLDQNSNLNKGKITWDINNNLFDRFEITVKESGNLLYIDNSQGTSYVLRNELSAGSYTVSVRTINRFGRYSDASNISFDISLPAKPTIQVELGNFELIINPEVTGSFLNTTYHAFIHTENDQAQARDLGRAGQFTVLTQPDTTYHIWVSTINLAGESSFAYKEVKTAKDATSLVDLLEGQLHDLHLSPDIRAKLEAASLDNLEQNKLIEEIRRELEQNTLNTLTELADVATVDIEQSEANVIAKSGHAIAKEAKVAVAQETETRALAVQQLETTFNDNSAAVQNQLSVITTEQTAQASSISFLSSTVNYVNANYASRSYVVSSVNSATAGIEQTIDAKFDQNSGEYGVQIKTAVDAANSATSKAEELAAGIYDSNGNLSQAFIDNVSLVAVQADGQTIAAAISSYTVSAGGSTHTIEQIASASIASDGSSFVGQWGVKTSLSGLTHGVGFYVSGGVTQFVVSTNNFTVFDPSSGLSGAIPFYVESGKVYIEDASIKTLSAEKIQGDITDIGTSSINTINYGGSSNVLSFQTVWEVQVSAQPFGRMVEVSSLPIEWGSIASIVYSIFEVDESSETLIVGAAQGQINNGWTPTISVIELPANKSIRLRGKVKASSSIGTAIVRGNLSVKTYKRGDGIAFLH